MEINLLNSAIKFTDRGTICLRASRRDIQREGRIGVRFEVQDSGIGIEPEEIGDLFQIFTQTESGRQSRSGTGLGLVWRSAAALSN
jgi:signal transduction histidine kinase